MSVTCQLCYGSQSMSRVLSLGYMPPPNDMPTSYDPKPQTWLPTELWYCSECELAQLGYVPDKSVAFPEDYPYTSSATPALRENFEELAARCTEKLKLQPYDLVVDIGSNDGTLLSCFPDQRVWGVEPTSAAGLARDRGVATVKAFFDGKVARELRLAHGSAKLITCTNCFAHMPDVHSVVEAVKLLLTDDGMFVTESHYLIDLMDTLQYDTIYAEHLRYYTVRSLARLFAMHGMRIVGVERIPTHGGSIRVYAEKGTSYGSIPYGEKAPWEVKAQLKSFADSVHFNKLSVLAYLHQIKGTGGRVVGIGAPSRGSTVVNYLRLDQSIVDYVAEQPHSLKIGRYMPGTDIPVVNEMRLYEDPPDAAILFSWHLADKLIPKIRARGFHGPIILPCSATIINESPAMAGAA